MAKIRKARTSSLTLNGFLNYMTGPGGEAGVCMREKVRVYLPTCYDEKTKVHKCATHAERARRELNSLFGGSTTWGAKGAWWEAKTGKMWDEPIIVVESAHGQLCEAEAKKFVNIIQRYQKASGEKSISVENGFTDFYIGEGEKWKPKYVEYARKRRR